MIVLSLFAASPTERIGGLSGVNFSNGIDDVRVGSAAAQVSAHPLSHFVIRQCQRMRLLSKIGRGVTQFSILRLLQKCHCGTYLAGRAKSTLKTVVLNKCGL